MRGFIFWRFADMLIRLVSCLPEKAWRSQYLCVPAATSPRDSTRQERKRAYEHTLLIALFHSLDNPVRSLCRLSNSGLGEAYLRFKLDILRRFAGTLRQTKSSMPPRKWNWFSRHYTIAPVSYPVLTVFIQATDEVSDDESAGDAIPFESANKTAKESNDEDEGSDEGDDVYVISR